MEARSRYCGLECSWTLFSAPFDVIKDRWLCPWITSMFLGCILSSTFWKAHKSDDPETIHFLHKLLSLKSQSFGIFRRDVIYVWNNPWNSLKQKGLPAPSRSTHKMSDAICYLGCFCCSEVDSDKKTLLNLEVYLCLFFIHISHYRLQSISCVSQRQSMLLNPEEKSNSIKFSLFPFCAPELFPLSLSMPSINHWRAFIDLGPSLCASD